jgi:hypothetical protein
MDPSDGPFDFTDGPDPDDPDGLDDRVLIASRELADLDAELRRRDLPDYSAERRAAAAFGALEAAFGRLGAGSPLFLEAWEAAADACGELRLILEEQLPDDVDGDHGEHAAQVTRLHPGCGCAGGDAHPCRGAQQGRAAHPSGRRLADPADESDRLVERVRQISGQIPRTVTVRDLANLDGGPCC